MATAALPDSSDFDFLLQEVCTALQLPKSRHERAEQSYGAVVDWLGGDSSPLKGLIMKCYPQGSMALGTTNMPVGRAEYDLDFVTVFDAVRFGAMPLYDMVYERLRAHATYKPIVERCNRCVSLNYANEFHLDVVPAVPDITRGGTAILITDQRKQGWTSSDPKGYAAWFRGRGESGLTETLRKAAEIAPVPDLVPAHEKSALTLAVQLLKRRRDLMYTGAMIEDAPKSIILTTLAGAHYHGSTSVSGALVQILDGMTRAFAAAHPNQIIIYNPTNPSEHFCDSMTPARYATLVEFANQVRQEVLAVYALTGPSLRRRLEELFGASVVTEAFNKWTQRANDMRQSGTLRASASGLTIMSGQRGVQVRDNTFHGD